jgi:hypothetical protein
VRDALRRAGGELALPTPPLAELASPPRPGALCLAVASLVWHTALGAERATLAIEQGPSAWHLRLACARPGRPGLPGNDVLRQVPGTRCTPQASGWSLELPAAWLAPGKALPAEPAR